MRIRKIQAVVKKEMQEVAHDRTMLLVLIAFPVFIMVFMGSSFRALEINGLPIGLSGPLNTTFAETLVGVLNESSAFNLRSYGSEGEALTAFRNGQLRAVIVVPEDFEQSLRRGAGSTIRIVVDNSDLALEKSIVAAMSSVVQASSANITKTYVSSAWEDLQGLNTSADMLSSDVSISRERMRNMSVALSDIRMNMSGIELDSLEDSLGKAAGSVAELQMLLSEQKAALKNSSEENKKFFKESGEFLSNASLALNESIETVEDTHAKLQDQIQELNDTITVLDASIDGLEEIRDNTTDNDTKAALELNIAALEALKNSSEKQKSDAEDESEDLEELNETLQDFSISLGIYSQQLAEAEGKDTAAMEESLENASIALSELNSSFAVADSQVNGLKALLIRINSTMSDMEDTLDSAIAQAEAVDSLIGSLQETVAEQTAKDPKLIASPLAIKVENQYQRTSFVDFIMPQIIAVSLLFSCFLLGSISIVREKTRNTIIRILMIPGALGNLVIGKIFSLVLLSFLQVTTILVVATLLFGVKAPENMIVLLWGTAIASLVLSSIGIIIGFYARRESAAIQTCLLIAIPMLFLGNIIFSPDLLPNYTQILQLLLPLAHVTSIFKIVLITNGDPALSIGALLSYFILLAAVLAYIVVKRRDISHY